MKSKPANVLEVCSSICFKEVQWGASKAIHSQMSICHSWEKYYCNVCVLVTFHRFSIVTVCHNFLFYNKLEHRFIIVDSYIFSAMSISRIWIIITTNHIFSFEYFIVNADMIGSNSFINPIFIKFSYVLIKIKIMCTAATNMVHHSRKK